MDPTAPAEAGDTLTGAHAGPGQDEPAAAPAEGEEGEEGGLPELEREKSEWAHACTVCGVSSKIGSVAGGIAGAAIGATTVQVPYYFMGIIPWGTASVTIAAKLGTTVAALGWVASWAGMGAGLVAAPAVIYAVRRRRQRRARAQELVAASSGGGEAVELLPNGLQKARSF